MRIALVGRMDEREVHIHKMLNSLVKRGYDCLFVGWNRFAEPWQPAEPQWERRVWHQPAGMGMVTTKYFLAFRKFIERALESHPVELAIGVNEEVVYLMKSWRGRLFSSLLLDTRDELDRRVGNAGRLVQGMLCHVASRARDAADTILSSDPRRREGYRPSHRKKTLIVPNYPTDCGAPLWQRMPEGEFRIFAGGALSKERGLEFLLAAAEAAGVAIRSAGRLMDEYARDIFCRHPLVNYLGCLTPEKAMEQLADCHASVAFYAPGPAINRLASPNKVYDALCVGRPILVSDETEIADWVERNGVGHRIRYGDVAGLAARLGNLRAKQAELPGFARRARELFLRGYSWESQEPVLYSAIDSVVG